MEFNSVLFSWYLILLLSSVAFDLVSFQNKSTINKTVNLKKKPIKGYKNQDRSGVRQECEGSGTPGGATTYTEVTWLCGLQLWPFPGKPANSTAGSSWSSQWARRVCGETAEDGGREDRGALTDFADSW